MGFQFLKHNLQITFRISTISQTVKRTTNTICLIYFRFLTLLAFQVFLEEKVGAAILEVGIGGEFDCTNIVGLPEVL
nr:unnamed protein product [Callosobruchus analis]